MNRKVTHFAGTEIIDEYFVDVGWSELREKRNAALKETDWRFMSDQSPSEEWVTYRQFLRDLPENFSGDNANAACDAWHEYDIPE